MPTYNFRKRIKLYVVVGGLRYRIETYPDVSMSQTFEEEAVSVKTLHSQKNLFDSAVITKGNPANFSFTMPCLENNDFDIVYNLLVDYDSSNVEVAMKTADIYVETDTDIYKLEYCVIESGVFNIERNSLVTLSISGTARKLTRVGNQSYTIPGTLQSGTTDVYTAPRVMEISINNVVQANINSVSIELKNDINWLDYNTLHKSLAVTDATNSMFAGDFVVNKRVLSGNIQQYVVETGNVTNTWAVGVPLRIRLGNGSYSLDFNIPEVVFTTRVGINDLITQSYDFRMISNPTNLNTVILL